MSDPWSHCEYSFESSKPHDNKIVLKPEGCFLPPQRLSQAVTVFICSPPPSSSLAACNLLSGSLSPPVPLGRLMHYCFHISPVSNAESVAYLWFLLSISRATSRAGCSNKSRRRAPLSAVTWEDRLAIVSKCHCEE